MVSANKNDGKLADFVTQTNDEGYGLTGAQIAAAYKAALSDFVLRKTNRSSIAEVSKLLCGALQARKQQLAEQNDSSSHRIENYF